MNSRERVLTAFAHQEPDRVPYWCGASWEFWENAKKQLSLDDEGLMVRFGDDFRRVGADYTGPKRADGFSIFGIDRQGEGYGQPMNHPLANATIKEIHSYPWPDPKWMDPSTIKKQADIYKGQYAILGGDWSQFWHDAIDMFGMENICIKMYEEPEIVDAVFEHLVGYYFEVNKRIFEAAGKNIDIFFIGNDLGSQNGPLLSPEMFKRFLFPHFKRLIDLGHAYNLKVQLHCCGGVEPLLVPLIEAGLDAIHSVQTTCLGMNLKELKEKYGKKIVFNGGIDSHHVLIQGTPSLVNSDTWRVLRIMAPGGGYIAGASHDSILLETPLDNVLAMFDAIREYGGYKK